MDLPDKISLLSELWGLATTEGERVWERFRTMLYSSTGLLGVVAYLLDKRFRWPVALIAVVGLVLCCAWLQVYRMSRYYHDRWAADADALIQDDPELAQAVKARRDPRVSRPTARAASAYAMLIPLAFAAGWLTILVISLLKWEWLIGGATP